MVKKTAFRPVILSVVTLLFLKLPNNPPHFQTLFRSFARPIAKVRRSQIDTDRKLPEQREEILSVPVSVFRALFPPPLSPFFCVRMYVCKLTAEEGKRDSTIIFSLSFSPQEANKPQILFLLSDSFYFFFVSLSISSAKASSSSSLSSLYLNVTKRRRKRGAKVIIIFWGTATEQPSPSQCNIEYYSDTTSDVGTISSRGFFSFFPLHYSQCYRPSCFLLLSCGRK